MALVDEIQRLENFALGQGVFMGRGSGLVIEIQRVRKIS